MAGARGRLQLRGGERPQSPKPRRGHFTAAKQKRFFGQLAATCNVAAAARAARVRTPTVYDHRRKSARFRARWAQAIREGYARLELMMLDRAMNGTVKTVTRADGSTDKTHEYPNGIALSLLRLHRENAVEAEAEHDEQDVEELRARIARKIERLRARIAKEEAEEQAQAGTCIDAPDQG